MTDPLFDEWRAYQKLLDHDYMYHVAFFSRLNLEIQKRFSGPIAVLDLGCGNVSPTLPMLGDLDHVEMTSLVDHVQSSDFPETLSTYQSIGRAAGFGNFEILMQDREKLNHLVTLRG